MRRRKGEEEEKGGGEEEKDRMGRQKRSKQRYANTFYLNFVK
jgi:hypothetical protein